MKIRTGFVSNSSSSSFIVMGTKEAYDKAFEKLNGFEKAVIERFTTEGQIGTLEIKGISYGVDLNGDATDDIMGSIIRKYQKEHPDEVNTPTVNEEESEYTGNWAILENFQNSMAESGGVFTHTEGYG